MIFVICLIVYLIGAIVAKTASICYQRSPEYNQWLDFLSEDACVGLWPIFWVLGTIALLLMAIFNYVATKIADVVCPNKRD